MKAMHDTIKTACPGCKRTLNGAFTMQDGGPAEGDVSVCLYCGILLVYNADQSCREPTRKERKQIEADSWTMAQLAQVRNKIKEYYAGKPN